jgi:hypothetical protein
MRARRVGAAALAIAGLLSASAAAAKAPQVSSREARACAAKGGAYRDICLAGRPVCITPFADAGKRCTDNDQCDGACVYGGKARPGTRAVGRCQRDDDPCGCRTFVEKGRVRSGYCVD